MKKIIETKRLWLCEFDVSDQNWFFELNEDPEVIKYTGDVAFPSKEEAEAFLKNYNQYQLHGYGRWAVIIKQSNECIGWCGLKFTPDKNETDIGFRLFKKYWNNGYATEAAIACIDYGFNQLGLSKIVGRVINDNKASIKVLTHAGLKFEKDYDFNGSKGSCYSINKTDYDFR